MNPLYAGLLILSSATCLAVLRKALRYRQTKGALALIALLCGLFVWSSTYAVHWLAVEPTAKYFWLNMTYFGVVATPVFFFIFALRLTNKDGWLTKPVLALFVIEPVFVLFLVWTDPWTGWFFAGKRELTMSTMLDGSVIFWFHVVYSYGLLLASTFILLNRIFRSFKLYRWQLFLLLVSLLLPWGVNVMAILKLTPWPNLDATPIAFTFTAIAILYDMFGWHLLDIVPIARDLLIDNMGDGLLVLDDQNRILDFNEEARNLFKTPDDVIVGKSLSSLLSNWPNLVEKFIKVKETDIDIEIDMENPSFVHLLIKPINDKRNHFLGRLVTWRDITDRKQVEFDLQKANLSLKKHVEEVEALQQKLREQAIRDPLTGLYNRRFLKEVLEKEFSRASRENSSLVVVIIDVDFFKQVNDRFGHSMGDLVLQNLSGLLTTNLRTSDVICRYGGEEFVIVMPGISLSSARQRAEELREKIEAKNFSSVKGLFNITISLGMASIPSEAETSEDLLRAADDALYTAKAQGKNQVVIFSSEAQA